MYEESGHYENTITSEDVDEGREISKRDESASNSEQAASFKPEPKERINFNRLNKKEKKAIEQRLKREQQEAKQMKLREKSEQLSDS